MRKPSGFYASSLEMLLDTMCNVLGGVVFIALLVALVARDSPPQPSEESQRHSAQLTNQLAAVTASNAWLEAEMQQVIRHIQDAPNKLPTNHIRLPNLSETTKIPWPVIITNKLLYPVYVLSPDGRNRLNEQAIIRDGGAVTARAGVGEEPESSVAFMVAAFKRQRQATNFFFVFEVYDDSFPAFVRARETAAKLGYQYGWDPVRQGLALQFERHGEKILPQN